MQENNSDDLKRFGLPPQRNRTLNRRRSGDRFEKTSTSHGIDGDKSQTSFARNLPGVDHGDTGNNYIQNESTHIGLIALDGCCTSEAAQLLNDRWAATMHIYNDLSIDLSERPVMYSGASGSSWGHLKLPHQMDFATELRRAIHNATSSLASVSSSHN